MDVYVRLMTHIYLLLLIQRMNSTLTAMSVDCNYCDLIFTLGHYEQNASCFLIIIDEHYLYVTLNLPYFLFQLDPQTLQNKDWQRTVIGMNGVSLPSYA